VASTRIKRLVSLPISLNAQLKVAAEQQNISVSAFLAEAALAAINKAETPTTI
jgi:hypothetical protein